MPKLRSIQSWSKLLVSPPITSYPTVAPDSHASLINACSDANCVDRCVRSAIGLTPVSVAGVKSSW